MSNEVGSLILGVGVDIADFSAKMDALGNKLDTFTKQTQSAGEKSGGFLSQAFSFATGGLIAKGIDTLTSSIGSFFSDSIGESNQWTAAMNQAQTVVKSTAGAAGLTAQAMGDLASSLSGANGVSKYADDAVLSGEDLLATFTGIGKDVFPAATQTMLDMSAAMGTDLKGSAIQLGKALNDPAAGMSALTRVGVTFTKQQQDQIKTMEAAGNVTGAQKVILNELAREFGGSALTAAKSFDGQMFTLSEQFKNVEQSIGDALMPVLTGFLSWLTSPAVSGGIAAVAQTLADGLAGGAQFLGQVVSQIWPVVSNFVALLTNAFDSKSARLDLLQKLPGWLQPLGKLIGDLVGNFGEFFAAIQRGVSPLQAVGDLIKNNFVDLLGNLGPLLSGIGQVLSNAFLGALDFLVKNALPALGSALANLGQGIAGAIDNILAPQVTNGMNKVGGGFFDWVGTQVLPRVGEVFGTIASAIGTWITGGGLAALVANLQRWGQALVDWVGPMIPPLLEKLGELAGQAWDWITGTALPTLISKLAEWGQAFVAWVGPQIPPLLNQLGALAGQVWTWITGTALPTLISKLGEWGGAFVAWVGPQIGPLLGKLGDLLMRVGVWIITDAGPKIRTQLLEWGKAFIDWVGPQIPVLLGKLGDLLTQVGVWLLTVARPAIWEKLGEWGKAFLDWVTQDVLPFIGARLAEVGTAIVGWIGATASSLLGKAGEMGRNIIQGLLNALSAGKQQVINFIEGIAGGALDAIKQFFGISSPSKETYNVGTYLIQGLTNALQAGQAPLTAQIGTSITTPTLTALQSMVPAVAPALADLPAAFQAALQPVSDLLEAQATTPTDSTSMAYWWSGNPRALLQMMGHKIDQGSDSLKAYAGPAMKGVTDYVSAVIHNEMPGVEADWRGYWNQMVLDVQHAADAIKSIAGSIPTAPGGGGGGGSSPVGTGGGSAPAAGGGGGGSGFKSNLALGGGGLTKQAVQIIAYLQMPNGQLQQLQATVADIRQVAVASGGTA